MNKNYTTWSEAREILGEENFHTLNDLQDLHPDLRIMPEQWKQFQIIPRSPDFLEKRKKEIVVYPEISHDVNGQAINLEWLEKNFPKAISFEFNDRLKKFLSYPMSLAKTIPTLRLKWRIVFKNLGDDDYLDEKGKIIGAPNHIFIALLHQVKGGKMLWLNDTRPIFCPEFVMLSVATSSKIQFPLYAWTSNTPHFTVKSLPSECLNNIPAVYMRLG